MNINNEMCDSLIFTFIYRLVETCAIGHKQGGQLQIFVGLFICWVFLSLVPSDLAVLL